MDKLILKNMVGVDYLEFSINKYNIIVGMNDTNKELILKSIYLMRCIRDIMCEGIPIYTFQNDSFIGSSKKQINSVVMKSIRWSYIKEGSIIEYHYGDDLWVRLVLSVKKGNNFELQISDKIVLKFESILKYIDDKYGDSLDYYSATRYASTELNSLFGKIDKTYYFSSERFVKPKYDMYDNGDIISNNFLRIVKDLRYKYHNGTYNNKPKDNSNSNRVMELKNKLLDGEYFYRIVDYDFIRSEKYGDINIRDITDSQYGLLWLVNILYNIYQENEKSFIIIEYPELGLHSIKQVELMEYIVRTVNCTNSTIVIMTNSPYITTSLANYLMASKIVNKSDDEKVHKSVFNIIDEECLLNIDNVKCIDISEDSIQDLVYRNDCCDILDVGSIDIGSSMVSDKLDKLLDIDF